MGIELASVPQANESSDTINLCSLDVLSEQPVDPLAPVSRLDDEPPAAPVLQAPGLKARRRLVRWAMVLGGVGVGALVAALVLGILDRQAPEPAADQAPAAALPAPAASLPVAARQGFRSPPATPIATEAAAAPLASRPGPAARSPRQPSQRAAPQPGQRLVPKKLARQAQPRKPATAETSREQNRHKLGKASPARARELGSAARRRLRESLAASKRAIERRDWRQARRTAVTALRLDPRNQQARSMKRQAEQRIRRADRRAFVAKLAAQRRDWRRARKEALAALRIDPRNPRAKAIKARAQSKMRVESRPRGHQRTARG